MNTIKDLIENCVKKKDKRQYNIKRDKECIKKIFMTMHVILIGGG